MSFITFRKARQNDAQTLVDNHRISVDGIGGEQFCSL